MDMNKGQEPKHIFVYLTGMYIHYQIIIIIVIKIISPVEQFVLMRFLPDLPYYNNFCIKESFNFGDPIEQSYYSAFH